MARKILRSRKSVAYVGVLLFIAVAGTVVIVVLPFFLFDYW